FFTFRECIDSSKMENRIKRIVWKRKIRTVSKEVVDIYIFCWQFFLGSFKHIRRKIGEYRSTAWPYPVQYQRRIFTRSRTDFQRFHTRFKLPQINKEFSRFRFV